jgi:4-amino-4-deoxy-L-arabinose transferase-like glycosyltransferase
MSRRGVPPPERPPFGRPLLLLAPLLALAAALVLARPVTSWRTGADEAFYLRYAIRVADGGPGAFPALFREYLADPVGSSLFPSPARLTAIAYDAVAVRLAGPRFEALAYASLLAFLGMVTLAFVIPRRALGDGGAFLCALLVATSPLGLGMARRALTDTLNAFLLTACLGLVFHGLATRRGRRWWIATSIACALAFLGRELNVVLAPIALVAIAADAIRRRQWPPLLPVAAVTVLPAVLAMIVLSVAAGGIGPAWQALAAVVTQPGSNEYALKFGGGPWYRYLVDNLVLSPWTTLLYVMWLGHGLATRLEDEELLAWTLAPLVFVACVVPFAKFVRWALFLDVPMRMGAVALLLAYGGSRRRVVIGVATLLLVATQLATFHRLFVVADMYDPTSVELLARTGFLPWP